LAYGEPLRESDRVHGPYPIMGSNGEIGRHERAIVKGPGIVIGRKGSAGTVTWVSEDFYPIDTAFYVVAKAPCRSIIWLYEAMRNLRLEAMVVDSGVPGLNRNVAATAELICPPSDIQESFERTIGPLRARIAANQNESRALVTLRDILLPRLMSDQIPQVTA
jgi:type I restriction enzyme S subunit